MIIAQSAFVVQSSCGAFIGIVAFDAHTHTAKQIATMAWGTESTYKEIDAFELAKLTKEGGWSVFTFSEPESRIRFVCDPPEA